MTYEIGQRVEVERLATGMYFTGTIDGPTWTGATVVSFHPGRGVAGTYMLNVDGYPPGGMAWPEVMRPAPTTTCEATWAVGDRCEALSADDREWLPAVVTVVAPMSDGGFVYSVKFADGYRGVRLAGEMRKDLANYVEDQVPRATTPPPTNATCRCGAPSLALFSSTECSRGAECPIVAVAAEPDEVRLVWGSMGASARCDERVYEASGRGVAMRHPLRDEAVRLWREVVAEWTLGQLRPQVVHAILAKAARPETHDERVRRMERFARDCDAQRAAWARRS